MIMRAADRQSEAVGWARAFLTIALLGAILGFAGIADVPAYVSWVLLLCSAVFAAAFFGPERNRRS